MSGEMTKLRETADKVFTALEEYRELCYKTGVITKEENDRLKNELTVKTENEKQDAMQERDRLENISNFDNDILDLCETFCYKHLSGSKTSDYTMELYEAIDKVLKEYAVKERL